MSFKNTSAPPILSSNSTREIVRRQILRPSAKEDEIVQLTGAKLEVRRFDGRGRLDCRSRTLELARDDSVTVAKIKSSTTSVEATVRASIVECGKGEMRSVRAACWQVVREGGSRWCAQWMVVDVYACTARAHAHAHSEYIARARDRTQGAAVRVTRAHWKLLPPPLSRLLCLRCSRQQQHQQQSHSIPSPLPIYIPPLPTHASLSVHKTGFLNASVNFLQPPLCPSSVFTSPVRITSLLNRLSLHLLDLDALVVVPKEYVWRLDVRVTILDSETGGNVIDSCLNSFVSALRFFRLPGTSLNGEGGRPRILSRFVNRSSFRSSFYFKKPFAFALNKRSSFRAPTNPPTPSNTLQHLPILEPNVVLCSLKP